MCVDGQVCIFMYVNNGAWYVVMSSTGSGTDRDIEEHSKIENGVWWDFCT